VELQIRSGDRVAEICGIYKRVQSSLDDRVVSCAEAQEAFIADLEAIQTFTELAVRHSSVNQTLHKARIEHESIISLLGAIH
jgi:hypothetical protein